MSPRGYSKVVAARRRLAIQAAAEQGAIFEERYFEAQERQDEVAAEDAAVDHDIENYLMDKHEKEA